VNLASSARHSTTRSTFGAAGEDHGSIWDDLWAGWMPGGAASRSRRDNGGNPTDYACTTSLLYERVKSPPLWRSLCSLSSNAFGRKMFRPLSLTMPGPVSSPCQHRQRFFSTIVIERREILPGCLFCEGDVLRKENPSLFPYAIERYFRSPQVSLVLPLPIIVPQYFSTWIIRAWITRRHLEASGACPSLTRFHFRPKNFYDRH